MFKFNLGDRVIIRKGVDAECAGQISLCDSPISEHQGKWQHIGEQGFLLIWVILDDSTRHSADPSGGSWRLAMNLAKIQ